MKTRKSRQQSSKQSKTTVKNSNHRITRSHALPSKICIADPQGYSHENAQHPSFFLDQLRENRRDGHLVDITLDVQGEKIYAHKVVLATCIPYFQAMFSNGFKEGNQDYIKLQDLNPDSVSKIVDYVYSGCISVDGDNCSNLLETANFLQVDGVKDACSQYLADKICVENCVAIYMSADLFRCSKLCETAKNFIVRHFKEVDEKGDLVHLPQSLFQEVISVECLNFERDGKVPNAADCENTILVTVIAYVRHQLKERLEFLPSLLSHIHLPSLSPTVLAKFTEMDVIQSSPESLQLITTAQKWHKPRQTSMSRVFSFAFDEIELLRNTAVKKSPTFQFHNHSWSIRLQSKYFEGKRYIGLFLGPESTSYKEADWFSSVDVYFELLSHKTASVSISESFMNHYDRNSTGRGYARFVEWDQLVNPSRGFLSEGKIEILVRLKAHLS